MKLAELAREKAREAWKDYEGGVLEQEYQFIATTEKAILEYEKARGDLGGSETPQPTKLINMTIQSAHAGSADTKSLESEGGRDEWREFAKQALLRLRKSRCVDCNGTEPSHCYFECRGIWQYEISDADMAAEFRRVARVTRELSRRESWDKITNKAILRPRPTDSEIISKLREGK